MTGASRRGDLPSIDELPIPEDAAIGKGWTEQMIEMAAHIGVFATLQIVDAFGGEHLYIAQDPEQNRLRDVIGPEKAAIMSYVYGRERLRIPTARIALAVARRQPLLAAIRAGRLTVSDVARVLGSTPNYVSELVNTTLEGTGVAIPPTLPSRRRAPDARQMEFFGED